MLVSIATVQTDPETVEKHNSHGKNYKRLTFLETTMTVGAQKLISKNIKFL